jgi:hypothetical protein
VKRFAISLVLLAAAACGNARPEPTSPAATRPPATPNVSAAPVPQHALTGRGTFAAIPLDPRIAVYRHPDAPEPRLRLRSTNPVGQALALLVTEEELGDQGLSWLRVLLPVRPNGSSGWVRADDVEVEPLRERIVVDLSSRTLRHFREGELVSEFSVGIGRPETPTALGTFYIWAHVPQANPTGPYGNYALGLSGFSEVLKDWPGGGRMAIHGTADPADRGAMVSHGCVRVFNPEMRLLKRVPLGTPVIVRP